jgi:hypothetical protein
MTSYFPMAILAALLILALSAAAYFTLRKWRNSRTPTPQTSPEKASEKWLEREAHNAEDHRVDKKRGGRPSR